MTVRESFHLSELPFFISPSTSGYFCQALGGWNRVGQLVGERLEQVRAPYINIYVSVGKGPCSDWGPIRKGPSEEVTPERLVGLTSDISLGSGLQGDVWESHQQHRDSRRRGVPALSPRLLGVPTSGGLGESSWGRGHDPDQNSPFKTPGPDSRAFGGLGRKRRKFLF